METGRARGEVVMREQNGNERHVEGKGVKCMEE